MANPQKENGYTSIANEILEQVCKLKINGTQFRIIMAIWRYTYGFNRKEHSLSETFLSKAIGIARPHISREIKPLFDRKILLIIKQASFTESAIISFNKNYDDWKDVSENTPVTELGNTPVTELGNTPVTELGTQERKSLNKIKEKRKKESNTDNILSFNDLIDSFTENEELRFALKEHLKTRKAKKATLTNRALELSFNKLQDYTVEEQINIVNESIEKGWTTYYPKKDISKSNRTASF